MHGDSNSTNVYSVFLVRLLAAACVTLAGCGGTALLKDVRPLQSFTSLAEGKDQRIVASIENVIVPNSEGAWACNAEWDEYLIRIRALADEPVQIREIAIFDALNQRIEPRSDRGELVDGTREIQRRYAQSGKLVRTGGVSGWILTGSGIVGVASGTSNAVASSAGFLASGFAMPPGAIVLAGGGLLLAGAGVVRLVNNAQVNNEIKRRRTSLPVDLPRGAETSVDLFFPATPLSRRAEVVYVDGHGEHRVHIDTRQARLEVDRDSPPALLRRRDPKFPDEARRAGISEGYVKANLTLDRQGRVRGVDLIEAVPPHVFIMEARRTLPGWTYSEGRNDCRIVEATLEFKR